jgi:surfeit locus 1 family protein
MNQRIPIFSTIVVLAAVGAMVWLGIWQLHRAAWKKDLIAQFETNAHLPPIAWPAFGGDQRVLYRHAHGFCLQVVSWRTMAGRNLKDEPGWSHIASCRTGGAEGPGMEVDIGWATSSANPAWKGGEVSGVIVPDRKHQIRLVADKAAPGLQPSQPGTPATTANNHIAYAVQWFAFAVTALVIYGLALRRRRRPVVPEPVKP